MTTLLNLAKMTVSGTPGTGNITLGSAVTSWQSFAAAGATNGMVVSFNAVDGSNQQDGTATYSTTGPSLTGLSITDSSTGSPLNLTSAAVISLTARAQDIVNKTGDTMTGALNWATAATVASATTTDIGAAASNLVNVTGTTTITGLGTIAGGAMRWVKFGGVLTLTYNATSLINIGAANITTAANDMALFVSEGSGNWRMWDYQRADGSPLSYVALDARYSTITRSINAQFGTTYTFVIGDAGNFCAFGSNLATTVTVPPNSSVAFPIGTQIDLAQTGPGKVTLAAGSGVTINSISSNKVLSARYAGGTLVQTGTDVWLLIGSLTA